MGYVEGANASNLQCLEYLSQDKCLSSLHKGLCSNPCVQVSVYKGSQWALFVATHCSITQLRFAHAQNLLFPTF